MIRALIILAVMIVGLLAIAFASLSIAIKLTGALFWVLLAVAVWLLLSRSFTRTP